MSHEAHIADLQTKIDDLNGIKTKLTAQKSFVDNVVATTVEEYNAARLSASADVQERVWELPEGQNVASVIAYLQTEWTQELTDLNTMIDRYVDKKAELQALEDGTWTEDHAAWRANPTWRIDE